MRVVVDRVEAARRVPARSRRELRALDQRRAPELLRGLPERDDLGMGRGISIADDTVSTPADDPPSHHRHRTGDRPGSDLWIERSGAVARSLQIFSAGASGWVGPYELLH